MEKEESNLANLAADLVSPADELAGDSQSLKEPHV